MPYPLALAELQSRRDRVSDRIDALQAAANAIQQTSLETVRRVANGYGLARRESLRSGQPLAQTAQSMLTALQDELSQLDSALLLLDT